jgi:hypothetical protein
MRGYFNRSNKNRIIFFRIYKIDVTTGLDLFNELINVITKFQLNINDIRGQGYDNGSNMKGNK